MQFAQNLLCIYTLQLFSYSISMFHPQHSIPLIPDAPSGMDIFLKRPFSSIKIKFIRGYQLNTKYDLNVWSAPCWRWMDKVWHSLLQKSNCYQNSGQANFTLYNEAFTGRAKSVLRWCHSSSDLHLLQDCSYTFEGSSAPPISNQSKIPQGSRLSVFLCDHFNLPSENHCNSIPDSLPIFVHNSMVVTYYQNATKETIILSPHM